MKRLFILASAAALMLASCAKTTVVYNEAPEEIGFKAVTGVMTKAGVQTLGDNNTMGVFAANNSDKSVYFGNTEFSPVVVDESYEWVATETKQYWPLDGNLDFAVYSPYVDGDETVAWNYTSDPEANELEIKVDNDEFASQTDWLYGTAVLTDQTKKNTVMNVTLRHALAKITVNVTSDLVGLQITSLSFTNTIQTGTLKIDYTKTDNQETDTDEKLSWSNTNNTNMEMISEPFTATNENKTTTGTHYVIPGDQTSFVMKYKLTAESQELEYTYQLNANEVKWVDGKHYTYTINITANEIKFNPSETTWTTDNPSIVTDPSQATPVTPTPAS